MNGRPRGYLFSDAPFTGGAEQYLAALLHHAGPQRLGLIGVAHPGLAPWLQAMQDAGFDVQRLQPAGRMQMWIRLGQLLRRLRPELLHVNLPGPYDGLLATAPAVARLAGMPRILVTEHLPSVGAVGKRFYWKRAMLGAIDVALCVCEAHRDVLVRTFGYRVERVTAIANGIPDPNPQGVIAAAHRQPPPPDLLAQQRVESVRILQVGSLDPRKGADVLIEAVQLLREEGRRLELWLAGEGPQRDALQRQIERLRLEDQVRLLGHRADVHRLWPAVDVAVLASYREGMSYALLEAAAWGLPTVATDVDGNAEVVLRGRTGLLVDAGDAYQLAWALGELAGDPERRVWMGRAARRHFATHFGLARCLQRTFAAYGQGWEDLAVQAVDAAGAAVDG